MADGREFYGLFTGIDKQCAIILQSAIECIDSKYVHQVNENMVTHYRDHMSLDNYVTYDKEKYSNEEIEAINKKFAHNKFQIGQTIIPKAEIKKILI